MIPSSGNLRANVEKGRRLAQHVSDPSVRLALLNLMNQIDDDLARSPRAR
jgi:hypothetical protein